MALQTFLQAAWRDHGDDADDVGRRIAEAFPLLEAPADVGPFVRLLTHVYGEHLGQWQRGVELLAAITRLPAFDGSPLTQGPVTRGTAVLRYASGDAAALDGLTDEDATYALAMAADALGARGRFAPAIDAFDLALARAPDTLTAAQPATRALAMCGNNLSVALEKSSALGPAEARAMVAAAEAGLRYWKIAGTWLEEERAEYQLSRSQLRAGDLDAATASIARCLAICTHNDAPPFERFFGHAVQAIVCRTRGEQDTFAEGRRAALEQYARIPEEERKWCERERAELGS